MSNLVDTTFARAAEHSRRAQADRLLDEARSLEQRGDLPAAIAKRNLADAALADSIIFGGLTRHVR